jgi:branched-chain amino acid transport system permease protein
MGISTTRYKVIAFVISAALAGVAGGLSGQLFANPLNPQNLNFVKSIEVVVMIVLGGIGSITGAVFGAATLTVLPEALRGLDQQFPGLRMVLYALLLILFMIFRPQGLFGRKEFGWDWLRRPNRTKIPVALSDVKDARQHTGQRPVDRRSTLGGSDTDD